jgi:hypothetical protein
MIQVTSTNNQLKVVTNGLVEYYSYEDIKSFSPFHEKKFITGQTPTTSYVVVVNFINENKNSPLKLRLSQIDNQATWVNTPAGLDIAIGDLSGFMNTASISSSTVASIVKATGLSRVTAGGTIAAGMQSISISNVHASANGTVKGFTLKPGESISWDAGSLNNTLDAVVYDATGTEFLIGTIL